MILTIGHSTHPIEEFLEMLRAHSVKHLVDVRTVPRSRHNPQFEQSALGPALRRAGISYTHMKGLGGLRHPRADSINTAWKNAGFRGYADYILTAEFEKNLSSLLELAEKEQVAMMCAEAVPWRCHRSIISDALVARGVPVEHILSAAKRQPHKLTPFARVEGQRVTYPGVIP
jgi:uncharacterized protein (DUF488 family)